MNSVQIHSFHPATMNVGDSHGGIGELLADRVASNSKSSSIRHVDLVVLRPGATIAAHRHSSDNEEIYVVVKGEGLMQIEDDGYMVSIGDVVRNLPGGKHGLRNTASEDLWLVVIETKFSEG